MPDPTPDAETVAAAPLAPPSLAELCRRHDIRFKKSLGQNLLLDDNINRIMVDAAALDGGDAVVEAGAGLGALTRRIAQRAGRLLSIEIDASFMPCLEEQFGALPNVRLFRGDVLNHEMHDLVAEYLPGAARYKFLSNLPYYITTPILFHVLESRVPFERLVVMMQLEVAERLTAEVDTRDYGVLALAARCYAAVDIVHRVPASCFVPRPKVDSAIVRFRCHAQPPVPGVDPRFVMRVIRAAFLHRRKTLRNSLVKAPAFGAPGDAVLAAMEAAGIDPQRRPQTLAFEDWARLAIEIRGRV